MTNTRSKQNTVNKTGKIVGQVAKVNKVVDEVGKLNNLIQGTLQIKNNIIVDLKTYSLTSLDTPIYM